MWPRPRDWIEWSKIDGKVFSKLSYKKKVTQSWVTSLLFCSFTQRELSCLPCFHLCYKKTHDKELRWTFNFNSLWGTESCQYSLSWTWKQFFPSHIFRCDHSTSLHHNCSLLGDPEVQDLDKLHPDALTHKAEITSVHCFKLLILVGGHFRQEIANTTMSTLTSYTEPVTKTYWVNNGCSEEIWNWFEIDFLLTNQDQDSFPSLLIISDYSQGAGAVWSHKNHCNFMFYSNYQKLLI